MHMAAVSCSGSNFDIAWDDVLESLPLFAGAQQRGILSNNVFLCGGVWRMSVRKSRKRRISRIQLWRGGRGGRGVFPRVECV
jgi:hypothetical protein